VRACPGVAPGEAWVHHVEFNVHKQKATELHVSIPRRICAEAQWLSGKTLNYIFLVDDNPAGQPAD